MEGVEQLRVLLVEDDDQHAEIIARHLAKSRLQFRRVSTLRESIDCISKFAINLVLLDLSLPDCAFGEPLNQIFQRFPNVPLIVLSCNEDRAFSQKMVREGAQDCICKSDLSSELLIRSICYSRERKKNEQILKDAIANKVWVNKLSELGLMQSSLSLFLKSSSQLIRDAFGCEEVIFFCYHSPDESFKVRGSYKHQDLVATDGLIPERDLFSAGFATTKNECETRRVQLFHSNCHDGKFKIHTAMKGRGYVAASAATIFGSGKSGPDGLIALYFKASRILSDGENDLLRSVANTVSTIINRCNLDRMLDQRISELRDAHRRKDEFLSALSHELRTPLSVITGYADMLKDIKPETQAFRSAIDLIQKNAQAEQKLVDDILEVSRIITGRVRLDLNYVNIYGLIESAVEAVSLAAMSKGIEIVVDSDDDLGEIVGDIDRLRQVLWNILFNAVKFTDKDGLISVVGKRRYDDVVIEVKDSGIGFPPHEAARVFNRFWQGGEGDAARKNGLGLGLSITKKFVELHGGKIDCYSAGVGLGATFSLQIPVKRTQSGLRINKSVVQDGKNSVDYIPQTGVMGRLCGKRVMLVEDCEDIRRMIEYFFETESAEIFASPSAGEGFKIFEESRGEFDVIVSDIGLPDYDGFELMRMIRALELEKGWLRVPSVALTAYAGNDAVRMAARSGFDRHVAKPVKKEGFISEVVRTLEQNCQRPNHSQTSTT